MNFNKFSVLENLGDASEVKDVQDKKAPAGGKKFKPATTSGAVEQPKREEKRREGAPHRGREYDRHVSGTGHLKGEQKKEGAGKGNWGAVGSEIAEEAPVKDEAEVENKEAENEAKEEEEKTMTLEEYRKQQKEKAAAIPAVKTGRSVEEQQTQWKDTHAAHRDDQEVWTAGEKKEKAEKEKQVKQKVIVETNFHFQSTDRESRRGGRGGRGRFGGDRRPREERPAPAAPVEGAETEAAPVQEQAPRERKERREGEGFRGGRGRGNGRGRGEGRGGRGGSFRGRGDGQSRPARGPQVNLSDETAFPKLG